MYSEIFADPVPMTSITSTFCILTSMRWDPILTSSPECNLSPFYLLNHHRQRLLNAAYYFHEHGTFIEGKGQWQGTIAFLEDTGRFEKEVNEGLKVYELKGPLKIRVILPIPSTSKPLLKLTASPVPSVTVPTLFPTNLPTAPERSANDWILVIDTQPTAPSPTTSHKTTSRTHYETSRSRCSLPPLGAPNSTNEVILYNPEGDVMEGSYTSLYFWRSGKWITPLLSSGGCEATIRRWLLEKGVAQEGVVKKEDLKEGEWVVMSNAVRGVWGGWIV